MGPSPLREMLRIAALEHTVAESVRKVQLGVQIDIDVFAEKAESLLGNDATSERLVELEAEFATKEWRRKPRTRTGDCRRLLRRSRLQPRRTCLTVTGRMQRGAPPSIM